MNAASANSIVGVDLEHLCSYWATLAAPESLDRWQGNAHPFLRYRGRRNGAEDARAAPDGGRRLGGCCGPMVSAYWTSAATLELDDGALIYTTYGAVVDLAPDGYNQFLRGILPPRPELRIAPRDYTGHADYLWLNGLQRVSVFDVAQSRVS